MADPAALKLGLDGEVRFQKAQLHGFHATRAQRVRALFEAHYERVYCFLSRRIGAERAEDLAQEVFFRLLKHRSLETVDVTRSYLFKIAENLVRNSARKDARSKDLAHRLGEVLQARDHGNSGGAREVVLGAQTLESAMSLLTANERSAITLIVCRGLSYEAASLALGVSVTTINNWKHRGVKKLRRHAQANALEDSQARTGARSNSGTRTAGGSAQQAKGSSETRSAPQGGRRSSDRLGRVG